MPRLRRCATLTELLDRYRRYLALLDRLRAAYPDEMLVYIDEVYPLMEPKDRDEPRFRAYFATRLRTDFVLWRDARLPVRYRVRHAYLDEAKKRANIAILRLRRRIS